MSQSLTMSHPYYKGDYDRAALAAKLQYTKKAPGNHPDVADAQQLRPLYDTGDYDRAIEASKKSLDIIVRTYGNHNQRVADAMKQLHFYTFGKVIMSTQAKRKSATSESESWL